MRLVTYERDGRSRSGVVAGGDVLDVRELAEWAGLAGAPEVGSVRAIVEAGAEVWGQLAAAAADAASAQVHREPLSGARLRAPIEDPDKIICIGLNYRDHAEESNLALPAAPMLFAKFRNSLVGPAADVEVVPHSDAIDYEAELAVVIGRPAKNVPAERALDHVAGVMAFNDLTARDIQHATSQWTAGKAIDGFAPCGPALVFLDEIADVQSLPVRARVNGETVQDGNTADMIFPVAELIAFISRQTTLVPGDVIATGTPAGVGISRDPQILLGEGDVVEVEIEGVGTLRNRFVPARDRLATTDAAAAAR